MRNTKKLNKTPEKTHVIIIGAGIGGLGTACLLAKKGYKVTVLEKQPHPGGRANIFEEEGFTFDMGPSWYLMPDIFEHFFKLMEEDIHKHLKLIKLSPSYRIFFKGDTSAHRIVDMYSDLERDIPTLEAIEPGVEAKLRTYLDRSGYQYHAAKKHFMYKNYDSLLDFFTFRIFKESLKMNIFGKMHRYVSKFFTSEKVQKIMEYTLVFLGSAPNNTPALYNIMNFIDFDMGVYYPDGGIYTIIESLVNMAKKHGTAIRTNTSVVKILTKNKKATGVELQNGEIIYGDIVISNADRTFTELNLLEADERDYQKKYWDKTTLAPGGFIMYLGLKDQVEGLTHHNLLFSENWDRNFAQIFDEGVLPDDPSYYVCCPTKTDTSIAPTGQDELFVLVPIPAGIEITPEDERRYRDLILNSLRDEMGITDIRQRIVYERIYHNDNFQTDYNAFGGSALGMAHTLQQTAIFRPNNVSKKVKNLYHVGAGTNPGIGMPICLISAEMVYKRIHNIKQAEPLKTL